ncbi:acyl-CoA dehydrogenase family protein [Mycolicibacterium moriokaense]|nr:acyl-CoA dehydrogenase family protein [Mycolicibacterium moriokaense]
MYNGGIGGPSSVVIDADLSPEQTLLRSSTARFIEDVCPVTTLRDRVDAPTALPPGYLTKAAELGWFAMLAPEECGGGSTSGQGLVDAALLSELRGARVQPGPFISMNTVAYALSRNGSERHRKEVLPAIVAGEHVAVWALADPEAVLGGRGGVTAEPTADGYRLYGEKTFVQDAEIAQSFLLDVVVDGWPRQVCWMLMLTASRCPRRSR